MDETNCANLDRLFYPRSIAVVGASPKVGMRMQANNYIKGSINQNFKGMIYPVHPKAENTMGFKSYARVRDIPDEVDLVIFAVPASAVLGVMEDCVEKGVKFVHFFTAGFSESGREEYAEIEEKIVCMAKDSGIRIVGPNCMGLYCPEGGLAFQPEFPAEAGSVGFFSQSGQLASYFIHLGAARGLTFSKVVSFGNASDLQAHDFLNYLAMDEKTEVIGSYLEGLKYGRGFFEAARNMVGKKPLVIYKGGQTEGGGRATQSHTGAIAGSQQIWESFCKQSGIISVSSMEEMACTLSALKKIPLPVRSNVAVLGGAGGGSVTMTDIAEKEGLKVPHLSQKTVDTLREVVPPEGSSVKNPLDVGFNFFFQGNLPRLMTLLRDDPIVDALIFVQPMGILSHFIGNSGVEMLRKLTMESRDILGKPLLLVLEKDIWQLHEDLQKAIEASYHEAGIATFPTFQMAARVFDNLRKYGDYLSALE
ncbi:MAG: hypothetical protein GY866_11815 [Proteobacteria bacterium]|nr:hypothetical protein [Pseudomonadota bacterium]